MRIIVLHALKIFMFLNIISIKGITFIIQGRKYYGACHICAIGSGI